MKRIVLAVSAVALLISGCGSDNSGQEASTDAVASETDAANDSATTPAEEDSGDAEEGGDGCDLISDELAAEILGVEIVRREPHVDATTGGVSCIKGTERVDDLTQASYVSVSVTPGGAAFIDEAIGDTQTESVPGLGDRAEYLASAASLIIAVGTDLVTVQIIKGGAPGSLDECVTAAEEVLGNV